MPLKKGEIYKCPKENCGCEVTVIKSAPATCSGTQNPTCCCGCTMDLVREATSS
jgi:hypothetical protein